MKMYNRDEVIDRMLQEVFRGNVSIKLRIRNKGKFRVGDKVLITMGDHKGEVGIVLSRDPYGYIIISGGNIASSGVSELIDIGLLKIEYEKIFKIELENELQILERKERE